MPDYVKTHQPCKACGSSDAMVYNDDGTTHCFSCDRHGGSEIDKINKKINEDRDEELKFIEINPEFIPSGISSAIADRGIDKETCETYGVTVDGTTHCYPYFNEDGEHLGNKVRKSNREGKKDFFFKGKDFDKCVLFGQSNFKRGGKYITICEGELDALSAYQMFGAKWPVVSLKSGASSVQSDIENNFEFLDNYENIVICFDNDTPGKKAAKKAAELLAPKGRIVHLNLKDANEYLSNNKIKDFESAWWNAEAYTPDGIIAGTDLWDVLQQGPAKTAVDYPFDGVDRFTYGIRMGELITVCAGTGIGKSSFLREIIKHVFDNTEDGIGMMFMEESVRSTAEAMMSLDLSKQLHLPETKYTQQEYSEAYKRTAGSGRYFFFDHFGSNSIDNVLARIRYFVKAVKCKYIILDHISILVSSQEHAYDERRTIDECMTKLRMLVQELDICMIIVSHLRRSIHGSHEEGLNTSLSDLRGSASIGQLSDIVIGLERNGQATDLIKRNTTYVRIIKNRFSGKTGICSKLFYDESNGRMRQLSKDPKDLKPEDDD